LGLEGRRFRVIASLRLTESKGRSAACQVPPSGILRLWLACSFTSRAVPTEANLVRGVIELALVHVSSTAGGWRLHHSSCMRPFSPDLVDQIAYIKTYVCATQGRNAQSCSWALSQGCSELQAQHELKAPRRADSGGAGVQLAGDDPETGIRDIGIRVAVDRMVEQIKCFGSELQFQLFVKGN